MTVPLDRVAAIYTDAHTRGQAPTKAVADALGISRAAASMRVSRAREVGLLPPTRRGVKSPAWDSRPRLDVATDAVARALPMLKDEAARNTAAAVLAALAAIREP